MSGLGLIGILVSVLLIGAGLWFGWQLLRQNGRILLRLDELEKRLDELEFAESSEPVVETVEPDANQPSAADGYPLTRSGDHPLPVGRGERGGEGQRETHFGNRSLARSKLKRDGLKAGTSAPSFRLPRLDGGELSLEELRGKRVLLVFSDLHCGPCQVLAPHLGKFHREHADISVVMISRGEPKENRAKVKEDGLTFLVVLQQRWEISRLYAMFATPIAYLIDERGVVANDVAAGVEPILALMADAQQSMRRAAAVG